MNKSKFADGSSLVITKNEDGVIVAVTRQDAEGKILEVLGESDFGPMNVCDNLLHQLRHIDKLLAAEGAAENSALRGPIAEAIRLATQQPASAALAEPVATVTVGNLGTIRAVRWKQELPTGLHNLYLTPRAAAPEVPETAWLVERAIVGRPHYVTIDDTGWFGWTVDHLKALRFARREDADRYAGGEIYDCKAVEYQWLAAAPHPEDRKS